MIRDMAEGDSAFLWESEALRSMAPRPTPPPPDRDPDWVTLREAHEKTGIPISTLRKWARRAAVPTFLEETSTSQLRMVSLRAVLEHAEDLGREVAQRTPQPPSKPPAAAEPETPPGTMLVPIDAWDKMLMQLGNLHEAGQQLAEARERAAKAETESRFLRERLAELRADLAEVKAAAPPRTYPPPAAEPDSEPIAHIPIESDDAEQETEEEPGKSESGEEVTVRDLGRDERGDDDLPRVGDGDELTLTEYSLQMMKHLYSTWRGRPRR